MPLWHNVYEWLHPDRQQIMFQVRHPVDRVTFAAQYSCYFIGFGTMQLNDARTKGATVLNTSNWNCYTGIFYGSKHQWMLQKCKGNTAYTILKSSHTFFRISWNFFYLYKGRFVGIKSRRILMHNIYFFVKNPVLCIIYLKKNLNMVQIWFDSIKYR
jgi:hypothetical protein